MFLYTIASLPWLLKVGINLFPACEEHNLFVKLVISTLYPNRDKKAMEVLPYLVSKKYITMGDTLSIWDIGARETKAAINISWFQIF